MSNDLITRPIRADEAAEAKRMVYRVAHPLMEPEITLEALIAKWDSWGILADMDDIQKNYFENGGVFLVTVDGGQIVGTGAFEHLTDEMYNVRRISLLPEYRRRGLGYAMMVELMRRAGGHELSQNDSMDQPLQAGAGGGLLSPDGVCGCAAPRRG